MPQKQHKKKRANHKQRHTDQINLAALATEAEQFLSRGERGDESRQRSDGALGQRLLGIANLFEHWDQQLEAAS